MGDYYEGLNEGKNIAKKDIEYLYSCFRKCVLGDDTVDDVELNKIEEIVNKYGFAIDEEMYLEEK